MTSQLSALSTLSWRREAINLIVCATFLIKNVIRQGPQANTSKCHFELFGSHRSQGQWHPQVTLSWSFLWLSPSWSVLLVWDFTPTPFVWNKYSISSIREMNTRLGHQAVGAETPSECGETRAGQNLEILGDPGLGEAEVRNSRWGKREVLVQLIQVP